MERNITVRLYESGDADGINAMFMKYLPYLRDRAFWLWINRIIGESISVVAEYQGKIVGHYAVVPRTINFNGHKIKSAVNDHNSVRYPSIFSLPSSPNQNISCNGDERIF